MSRRSVIPHPVEEERETGRARTGLGRAAEAEGVGPFTSLEKFAAPPELAAGFDVDGFLRAAREDRDRPAGRGAG